MEGQPAEVASAGVPRVPEREPAEPDDGEDQGEQLRIQSCHGARSLAAGLRW